MISTGTPLEPFNVESSVSIKTLLSIRNRTQRETLVNHPDMYSIYPIPNPVLAGSVYPNATTDSINQPHLFGIEGNLYNAPYELD